MIMNRTPEILAYLDIKKKDAPDVIHICFRDWLRMPKDIYKQLGKNQEQLEPGIHETCIKCGADLTIGDFGYWVKDKGVDYYSSRWGVQQNESS
ncbi:MAG: hypothetical protein DRI46_08005 [Chloroflexi bacterium]|nr:MAG: hypothetical protein DRI46_08005 [Chloroflexota bacterium]